MRSSRATASSSPRATRPTSASCTATGTRASAIRCRTTRSGSRTSTRPTFFGALPGWDIAQLLAGYDRSTNMLETPDGAERYYRLGAGTLGALMRWHTSIFSAEPAAIDVPAELEALRRAPAPMEQHRYLALPRPHDERARRTRERAAGVAARNLWLEPLPQRPRAAGRQRRANWRRRTASAAGAWSSAPFRRRCARGCAARAWPGR